MDITDYSKHYPLLPYELCLFFSEIADRKRVDKNLFDFCMYYKDKYKTKELPQPSVVARICDLLTNNDTLTVIRKAGINSMDNSYFCLLREEAKTNPFKIELFNKKLSFLIYGFKYIYESYRKYVKPVEYTDFNDDIKIGTCFLYKDGIATAKHCIKGAKKIAIQGFVPNDFLHAKFEIHENDSMDLVYIRFEQPLPDTIISGAQAEILDEIMTMGYPIIAGFHHFLNTENAIISSRFTASVGQISSEAQDIWIRERLFLITAKIKGGNSGGPIVNKKGEIVGVAVNLSQGEGAYDEMGYGTVIPISFMDDIINYADEKRYMDVSNIQFKNFE
jgi:serine protease Do